jgi:hypothetical protein
LETTAIPRFAAEAGADLAGFGAGIGTWAACDHAVPIEMIEMTKEIVNLRISHLAAQGPCPKS